MKADKIAGLLPAVFRRALPADDLLSSLLAVMETLEDPIETKFADIHTILDPLSTDARFVPMLASWVDLEWLYADDDCASGIQAWLDSPIEIGRMRLLISASSMLSQKRGTAIGLQRFLEIAVGVRGFSIVETGEPFHLEVGVPAEAQSNMALVKRIVAREKPAYATAAIVLLAKGSPRS